MRVLMRAQCWMTGVLIVLACAGVTGIRPADASLARNAAGPKNMGESGVLTIDTAVQFEKEADGDALAVETGVQYQLSKRLQFLVDAILYERFRPDAGESVSGFGDTEVTLSLLVAESRGLLPATVLGGKAKIPTASDDLGSGAADYSALLVLAQERGELEVNLELEFAKFGSPPGEDLKNQLLYSFTAEYGLTDFMAVYAEVFGNSAPSASESRTDAALFGVELDRQITRVMAPYVSFEIDTEEVATARAGIEWTW